MISLSILTVLGLVLMKMALNVLSPRQWTMQQSVSDAYMTFERALAERVPFEDLVGGASQWPVFPTTTSAAVEIGRLPGYLPNFPNGVPIIGTVVRTRIADIRNYQAAGGEGTLASGKCKVFLPIKWVTRPTENPELLFAFNEVKTQTWLSGIYIDRTIDRHHVRYGNGRYGSYVVQPTTRFSTIVQRSEIPDRGCANHQQLCKPLDR
jgi:hypothetical protein